MRKLNLALALIVVVAFAALTAACHSPNSPDGYDPSKPIGPGNVPVCTGNCALATATFGVYEGDCVDDVTMCSKEIFPTEDSSLWVDGREKTYLLKSHQQRYTVHLWVTHSGVPQRQILMNVSAGDGYVGGGSFYEKDRPSPVHMATSFNMVLSGTGVTNTNIGKVTFQEFSGDLALTSGNSWGVLLGFRVSGT